ncbi:hypothetical protein SprV_0200733400 [Sparganum proliferum]
MTNCYEMENKLREELHAILATALKTGKLVVLGKFNACIRTDHAAWRRMLGHHGIGIRNENDILPDLPTQRLKDLQAPDENSTVKTRWCQLLDGMRPLALDVFGRVRRQHQDWFDDDDADIKKLLAENSGLHKVYIFRRTDANKAPFFRCRRFVQQRLQEMQDA